MTSKSRIGRLSALEVPLEVEPAASAPEEPAPLPPRRLQLFIPEELYRRMSTYKLHNRSTSLTSIAIEALEEWATERGL